MITTLSNGMKVIVEEIRRSPVVSFQAWVQVGSGDEVGAEAGLSHMLEHMLFKGTVESGVGSIALGVESCGGEINAYTSFDQTVLHLVVPARNFARGLGVVKDAIFLPALDADEFSQEKLVVLEEIRRGEDDPSQKLGKALFADTFRVHPYGRPVIGTEDSVKAFSPELLRDFHQRWYRPSNVTLVVTGDFAEEDALAAIEESLSGLPGGDAPVHDRPLEPEHDGFHIRHLQESVQEVRMEMAFPLPSVFHPDIPVSDLLSVILGQGESSRLNQEIRLRRRLANQVQAFSYTPRDPGVFIIGLSCPPDDTLDASAALGEELGRVARDGVTTDELRRAVVNILSDRIYERETVEGVARKLGYFDSLFGDTTAEETFYAAISKATTDDLKRVAGSVFDLDRASMCVMTPREFGLDIREVESRLRKGYRPAPVSAVERPSRPATERVVLPNGATLLIRENPGSGLVSLRLGFTGGLRYETARNNGVHNLLSRVWQRGTSKRSALQIAQGMEEIAGRLGAFSGRNSIGLSSTFLASGIDSGLDIFREVLLDATFPDHEVERMRALVLEGIRNIPDNPVSLGFLHFHRMLYGKHPLRLPLMGTAASAGRITRGMIRSALRRSTMAGNAVMAVVGDFDGAEMQQRLAGILGELPAGDRSEPAIPEGWQPSGRRRKSLQVDKEQAHLFVGFKGARVRDPDRHQLEMLSAILAGQSGRLFLDLRDRQGLAYSVTAWSQEAVDPGFFAAYIGTDPARLKQAQDGIYGHLQRLLDEPVPEEELERAARYLIGTYEIGLQRGGSVASRILFDELYGLGCDYMEGYPERIMALTSADLQATAQERLVTDQSVELKLLPKEG